MSEPTPLRSAASSAVQSETLRHALAVSLRGCDELLPLDDWAKKLARS